MSWWKRADSIWYLNFCQWIWKNTWTHCHKRKWWNQIWCAVTCIKYRLPCYSVISAEYSTEIWNHKIYWSTKMVWSRCVEFFRLLYECVYVCVIWKIYFVTCDVGGRFWFGPCIWHSGSCVYPWDSHTMVSCTGSVVGRPTVLLPRRYLVNWMYFCWNGHQKTVVPRRFGNRPAIPHVQVQYYEL